MSTTFGGKTYSNGNVHPSLLAPLEPRGRHGTSGRLEAHLRRDAAASWNRAVAEVKRRTGLVLTVRGWNRSYAEQVTFFHRAYYRRPSGGYDVRWFRGVRYARRPGKAAAAIPGNSNHGWGLAVDVNDFGGVGQWNHPRRAAAMPILRRHGWTDTEGRQPWVNEPWHLVYNPALDKGKTAARPSTPTTEEWFDMAKYKRTSVKYDQRLTEGKWVTLKLNKKGHVSILSGPKNLWDSLLRVRLTGLAPGKEAHVRFVQVAYGGGKKTRILRTYPTVEVIGTGGTTFAQVAMRGKLPKDKGGQDIRLRVQIKTFQSGVRALSTETRTLHR